MKRILTLVCLPVWMLSPVKAQSTYQMAGPLTNLCCPMMFF